MSGVRSAMCALSLSFLFLVPLTPNAGSPDQSAIPSIDSGEVSYVRIHVPGAAVATLGAGVEVIETYESFVLARATESVLSALRARGVSVQPEDPFALRINGYAFDTRTSVEVPTLLAAEPALEGRGYYLVQFVGPVKEEWRRSLEGMGAEVLAYIPHNAYLIRGPPSLMGAIFSLPEVQWTGDFHPAFKISPDLAEVTGPVDVKIIVHDGEPVGSVVAALNKMGLGVVGRFAPGVGIQAWGTYDGFGLVKARVDPSFLVPLARLPAVRFLEPQYEMQYFHQSAQFVLQTNAPADGPGVRRIWDQGIRGQAQVIAVADSGLDYDHTQFRHAQAQRTIGDIYNVTDTNRRKVLRYLPMSGLVGVDPYTGGDPYAIKDTGDLFCFTASMGHGTATSSSAAGDDTGMSPASLNDGMAPDAKLVMLDIGSADASGCDTLSYIPDDYADMYGAAYSLAGSASAKIFSNSWGSATSAYTFDASMVDRFMWNNPDTLILFANGNNPPNPLVGSPATAKSLISVGASCAWNFREMTTGCGGGGPSTGPTADGRRKPDLATFYATGAPDTAANSDGDLTTFNSAQQGFGGTSYATPLAAGMAALVRQYFREGWYPTGNRVGGIGLTPTGALLKATMTASTVVMTGAGACPGADNRYPNIAQGWGRVWLDEGLYFPADTRRLWVLDHPTGLYTGDTVEYRLKTNTVAKLRVMLAWSDFPGTENANPALVNNLDLEVIAPSGTVYRGNVQGTPCTGGETAIGGSFDVLNNLEGVARNSAPIGDWRIRVTGANVPMARQRFALAVVGGLDLAHGVITIDKTVYGEGESVSIEVRDGDAVGPMTVQLTSNTEPGGEIVTMTRVGNATYRGFIPLSYAMPGPDVPTPRLQVSHGDLITARYDDPSPPHSSTATARVEIDPPAISNVQVTSLTNAAATITWTTDKQSDSSVFYGTTPALGTTATEAMHVTTHRVTLTSLTTETLYYFDVTSTRGAHTTRDDNGGRHYRFKTTEKAEILLVVADSSFPAERVDMYRNALQSASWSWNEWDVARAGDPTLAFLQTYKAVLWQSGLEQYPPVTDAQIPLFINYINGGGRLAYSGHDLTWAFCDGGSAFNTPTRCNFARSLLKGDYVTDPQTFTSERGEAADPISGAYTGGVAYVPHRAGGAADEVDPLNAGGATSIVWNTNSGANPDNDGVRWESSANNGTANPTCVWCGSRSRIVSMFFEFTGINYAAGIPGNVQRTDILNKTIVWLLGRAPPIVSVSSPNGGETIVSNSLPVQWSHSAGLATQEIWYSTDAGTSWDFVKAIAPGNTTDIVDISNTVLWPNGNRYLIRVVVLDAGSPALKAQDASNAVFTIRRPGGDSDGPVVRPGSLRVTPNPAKETLVVRFNATIDDTLRGGSNLFRAEYWIQAAMPIPADYGLGTPLDAVDTVYDEIVEDVTVSFAAPWPAGSVQTIWVHGQDDATPTRNWGDLGGGNSTGGSLMFLVIGASAGPAPNPPTNPMAALVNAAADVRISWTIPGGPAIDHFEIYFATAYDTAKTGYALLPGANNIPSGTSSFDHVGAGVANSNTYFYYVRAVNAGGGTNSPEQAAKYFRSLTTGGMQLVSLPLIPSDTSITSILQTLNWRTVRTFVATSAADPWKARYARGTGDLLTATAGMALWVDLIAPDDFVVAGQIPLSTTVTLVPGWNFIGYGSFIVRVANVALAPFGLTRLEGYSSSGQYNLQAIVLTTNLQPGSGYWALLGSGGPWTVAN